MNAFYLILLGFAVSIDGFATGIAYGLKKIHLPWTSLSIVGIITGLAVIVSRMMFPQIELTRLLKEAHGGNRGAGIVVAGLLLFVGLLILSLVMWAKA